jgi:DNA-binding NtrC family response regulator
MKPVRPNALIAVSNEALRAEYRDQFLAEGLAVATAANALTCLDHLRRCVPDVLILEDELAWGGAAGILALMEDADAPTAPVVLLYHGDLPAAAHCAAVQACLVMPTSAPDLAWAVQSQVVGRSHHHHERVWP